MFNTLKPEVKMTTRSRISFLFYIKRTKLLSNGEAPIYLKIASCDQHVELSIFRSVRPELWGKEKNGAVGTSKDAREVNGYI